MRSGGFGKLAAAPRMSVSSNLMNKKTAID